MLNNCLFVVFKHLKECNFKLKELLHSGSIFDKLKWNYVHMKPHLHYGNCLFAAHCAKIWNR